MLILPAGSQSMKSYPADAFKRATLRSVRCSFTLGAKGQTGQQEQIQGQCGWPHPAPCLKNTENCLQTPTQLCPQNKRAITGLLQWLKAEGVEQQGEGGGKQSVGNENNSS